MSLIVELLFRSIIFNCLLAVAVTLLCSIVLKKLQLWVRVRNCISKIPGPKTVLFFGNILSFGGDGEHNYKVLTDWGIIYTPIFRVWMGPRPVVIINSPETLKFVLNHPEALHKGANEMKVLKPWAGDSLLLAHPKKWKGRRALVGTSFSKPVINSFVPIMVKQSKIMVKCLEPHLDDGPVDLGPYTHKVALDTILATTMGMELDCQIKDNDYMTAVNEGVALAGERCFVLWQQIDWIYFRSYLGRRFLKNVKLVYEISMHVLRERKIKRHESNYNDNQKRSKSRTSIDLFLDLSTSTDSPLSENELLSELGVLIVAGYETTGVTSGFTLLMLAIHQDIQQEVYKEIWGIFGNSDRDINKEDLQNLKYLEMVIKETLRMFPAITVFQRRSDVDLDIGGYTVPKDTELTVWVPGIHRNELYWPNPTVFNPMRFTPEEIAKRHPCCFIPFSVGARNCIGMSYAYQILKIEIATLLRNYHFSTKVKLEDVRLTFAISLHSIGGYPVQIRKRNTPQDTCN